MAKPYFKEGDHVEVTIGQEIVKAVVKDVRYSIVIHNYEYKFEECPFNEWTNESLVQFDSDYYGDNPRYAKRKFKDYIVTIENSQVRNPRATRHSIEEYGTDEEFVRRMIHHTYPGFTIISIVEGKIEAPEIYSFD